MRAGSRALHSHTTKSYLPLGIVLSLRPSKYMIVIRVEWQEESPSSRRGVSWTHALTCTEGLDLFWQSFKNGDSAAFLEDVCVCGRQEVMSRVWSLLNYN